MQVVLNGVMTGSIYGLIAVSLALIFGVLEIPHFAMGGIGMFGAYTTWLVEPALGPVAGLVAATIACALLAVLVHALVFHPLRSAPLTSQFMVAFAALLVLQGVALALFGPNYRSTPPLTTATIDLAGAHITVQRLFVVILAAVLMLGLDVVLQKSSWGRRVRAVSQSRVGAAVVGINVDRVGFTTTLVAGALAGVATASLAPIAQIYPAMGGELIINAFVIIVLAGMGSIRGAMFCGYLIGLAESFGGAYISVDWIDAYPLLIFWLVLIVRPQGLFGKEVRKG